MEYPVYLDYNATTPCDRRVFEAMAPYFLSHYGNASSKQHAFGWKAEDAVEEAREKLAALVGASPAEIFFTSGATESVNLALKGVVEAAGSHEMHLVTAVTEHSAVLDSCGYLEKRGTPVRYLPVDASGRISLPALEESVRPGKSLVAVMFANNETGVLSPVRGIGEAVRNGDNLFFADATQAVGKVPVDVRRDLIDVMAFSAHKMYGPKGVGALFIRKGLAAKIAPQLHGGKHERSLRSGTLNVPGIVGFGVAAEIAAGKMQDEAVRLRTLRDYMEEALLALGGTSRNGDPEQRLPHVSNLSFSGVEGERFLKEVNLKIAVSSGSACSGIVSRPSHVLLAMGKTAPEALATLRIGLGRFSTKEEVEAAVVHIRKVYEKLSDRD